MSYLADTRVQLLEASKHRKLNSTFSPVYHRVEGGQQPRLTMGMVVLTVVLDTVFNLPH